MFRAKRPIINSLFVIAPYDYEGLWVFDDERVGLVQEPFVDGADTMIDAMVADIPVTLRNWIGYGPIKAAIFIVLKN